MFGGLTAKERLAQLQQKSGTKDPPLKTSAPVKKLGKINGAAEKQKEEAKPAATAAAAKQPAVAKPKAAEVVAAKDEPKKVETKPVEEPKKADEQVQPQAAKQDVVDAAEPVTPKVEEKPKEEPKQPEVKVEPPKAAEKPTIDEVKKQPEPAEKDAKPQEQKPNEEPEKVEPAKPKEEPAKVEVKEAAKAPEAVKAPVANEPPKAVAEEPKKTEPKVEPPKPKEQEEKEKPKPAEAKPTETKPVETDKKEPEKPVEVKPADKASAPAPKEPEKPAETKPADKVSAPAAKQPEKPKEAPKKPEPPAAAAAAKQKEELSKPQPKPAEKPKAEDVKAAPKSAPPKPVAEAAQKPAEPAKPVDAKPAEKPKEEPKKGPEVVVKKPPPTTDAMIGTIFYFSGMGNLLGSALAEGVYVPERNQRTALDADMVEAALESTRAKKREEIVVTARNQAQILSTDFRHLQALLESMPTFGEPLESKALDRRAVDQPIHGHVYFQQRQQQIVDGDTSAGSASLQPSLTREAKRGASDASVEAPISVSYTSSVYRSPPVAPTSTIVLLDQKYPSAGRQPEAAREARPFNPERVQQQRQQPQQRQLVTSSQAWQDQYGQEGRVAPQPDPVATAGARSPRLFNAAAASAADDGGVGGDRGSVDASGIKPWQLSHVRALEAKGYRLVSDQDDRQPETAAAFDGRSSATPSFSPYLVSDRTLNVDRQKTFQRGMMESPTVGSAQPFYPTSPGPAYPFAPVVESTMPYCDL